MCDTRAVSLIYMAYQYKGQNRGGQRRWSGPYFQFSQQVWPKTQFVKTCLLPFSVKLTVFTFLAKRNQNWELVTFVCIDLFLIYISLTRKKENWKKINNFMEEIPFKAGPYFSKYSKFLFGKWSVFVFQKVWFCVVFSYFSFFLIVLLVMNYYGINLWFQKFCWFTLWV